MLAWRWGGGGGVGGYFPKTYHDPSCMSIDGHSYDSHEYLTYSQRFSHEIVMTLFLEIFSQTR